MRVPRHDADRTDSADADWNLTAKPVAYDDEQTTSTGAASDVSNTLANDIIGFVPAGVNPTTITVAPSIGTATAVTSGTEIGRIRYTPPANASGTTSLKYRLKDGAGRTSNEATVVINVKPKASPASQSVTTGSSSAWAVPALGTGLTASITGAPAGGTASASGLDITYTAPGSASTQTIKYKVTDASGLVSDEATITVTVTVPTPPSTTDLEASVWPLR